MRITAYVDGSYMEAFKTDGTPCKVYGSGIYALFEGVLDPVRVSTGGNDPSIVFMRNVAGELIAVVSFMNLVKDVCGNDPVDIEIYYDYEGVEKWVTGEWRANKPATQAYRDFMRDMQKVYSIKFHHVKGHSGVAGNEMADRLARKGCMDYAAALGVTVR